MTKHVLHCVTEIPLWWIDDVGGDKHVYAICGAEVPEVSGESDQADNQTHLMAATADFFYRITELQMEDRPVPAVKCQECLNHSDLPLMLLGSYGEDDI